MYDLFRCMRPKHWVKNFFVAAPLVFAHKLYDQAALIKVALAFIGYCCIASSIYVLNDYIDLDRDKAHPVKKHRPLPAGKVTTRAVLALGAFLMMVGIIVSLSLNHNYRLVLGAYFIMNVAYSNWFKQAVILDVMVIATGFVLRVIAGSAAIDVPASSWLLMCTFLLALFIGFGKRRHEIVVLEGQADNHREVAHPL